MNPQHSFAFFAGVAVSLLLAACEASQLDPIGTTSTTTTGAGGTTGSSTTTGTTGGGDPGGSGGAGCAPACDPSSICVEGACHALVALDTTDVMNAGTCVIGLDATQVYWRTGELRRVPKAGGVSTLLDPATPSPGGLVVGDTYLFWTNVAIMRMEKTAPGKPGTSAGIFFADDGGNPTRLVGDADALYYLDSSAIYRADPQAPPAPGDPPTVFNQAWSSLDTPIALDADHVYFWTEGGALLTRVKRDHSASLDIASRGSSVIDASCGIAVDASGVYFSTAPTPGKGGLVKKAGNLDKSGTIIVDASRGANGVFALDQDAVYFLTPDGVMKQPKAGGEVIPVSLFTPPSPFPTCLAVDAQYVYWVDGSTLMRFTK